MSTEAAQRPVRVSDGELRLVGGRCTACATTAFPLRGGCPRCGAPMAETELPNTGTVWSWTVQRIGVKAPYAGPAPFEPYVVAYIDLGGLKIETPLFGRPVDGWTIGDRVQLVATDERPYLAFWFEPATGAAQ